MHLVWYFENLLGNAKRALAKKLRKENKNLHLKSHHPIINSGRLGNPTTWLTRIENGNTEGSVQDEFSQQSRRKHGPVMDHNCRVLAMSTMDAGSYFLLRCLFLIVIELLSGKGRLLKASYRQQNMQQFECRHYFSNGFDPRFLIPLPIAGRKEFAWGILRPLERSPASFLDKGFVLSKTWKLKVQQ